MMKIREQIRKCILGDCEKNPRKHPKDSLGLRWIIPKWLLVTLFIGFVLALLNHCRISNYCLVFLAFIAILAVLALSCVEDVSSEEESFLFSMNIRLEEKLNKSIVLEDLKKEFKTRGISLSDNARITERNENEWEITDEKM
ncbi:MAG TPA: hypothetical protein EYP28_02600 [Methanophagales archaeon]|nr:hypothetical protein [Methanophagales archaeon]